MCVVSMVTDHYMKKYPEPYTVPDTWKEDILELIRKAQEYDRLTGQRECPEADKLNWLEQFQKITMPPINLYTITTHSVK